MHFQFILSHLHKALSAGIRPRGELNITEAEQHVSGRNITRWADRSHAANLLHLSLRLRNMRHKIACVSGKKGKKDGWRG